MDPALLKVISANRTLRVAELRTTSTAVSAALDDTFGQARKGLLDTLAAGAPDNVRRALGSLPAASLASADSLDAVGKALDAAQVDAKLRDGVLADIQATQLFSPVLDDPDLPIAAHPAIQAQLAKADLAAFADAARLQPAVGAVLTSQVASLDTIDDATMGDLVDRNAITEADAQTLGLRLSLYHLSGGATDAAQALAGARFDALGGAAPSSKALLAVPDEQIAAALRAGNVQPPDGSSHDAMAADMKARLSELYPFEALQAHFGPVEPGQVTEGAKAIAPLLADNPDLFGRDLASLDLGRVPEAQLAPAQAAFTDLAKLVRRHPGLGLEQALSDPGDAGRNVAARLALVDSVVRQNAGVEFMALDYSADSADMKSLKLDGLADADAKAVLSTFKARQRVFAVTDDPLATARVMEAGYASSAAIAKDDFATFLGRTGLAEAKARPVYDRASGMLAGVSATIGSIIDVIKGGFGNLGVGNLFADVSDALQKLEGYADLFGPTDTCNCDHCQSILSPAAYFVDLMYFVEQNVTGKVFTGALATHALNLRVRRPDLWKLPLTCDNTNTLLPTLVIVNEVLDSYIAHRARPALDLADRKAVEALVYGDLLPNETASFRMPFVLAAARADTYLEAFDLTRAGLVEASGRTGTPLAVQAALKVAGPAYDVIVTPNLAQPYLRDLYQVAFVFAAGGAVDPVDVQDILPFANLTRAEFGDVLATRFVTADGARAVAIKAQKRSAASVQNDVERVTGLTAEALDAAQRFIRLWRLLPWSVAELDLVLHQVAPASPAVLDPAAFAAVAAVAGLATQTGLGVEEAAALWGDVPQRPLTAGGTSLFDRAFNNRPYVVTEGRLPNPGVSFVHPAFRTDATALPKDNTLQRLLLGLKLPEAALGELIRTLAAPLGANLADADEDLRGFALTAANLSLLFRHARLLKLLNRSPAELGQVLGFAGLAGGVASLDDVRRVLAFDGWVRSSGYTLDDVAFVTGQAPLNPAKYPAAAELAAGVAAQIQAEGSLPFADTVFAFIPGVTEDQSKAIVAANAGLFEDQPQGMLRLRADTATAPPIVIPPPVAAPLPDLQAALARHHVGRILPVRLAARLGMAGDTFAALAAQLGIDLGAPGIVAAVQGGPSAPLEAAAGTLVKAALAFRPAVFTAARLTFVAAHPALFGIARLDALTVADLRALGTYAGLLADGATPDATPDPSAVDASLAQFTAAQTFAAVPPATLGAALGCTAPVATALAAMAVLADTPLPALATLAGLARLTRDTGIGAETLTLLVSTQAADLDRGAEALVSTLRQRFPNDADFDARLGPLDNRLHGRKRDALADRVIRHGHQRFTSLDDLYDYFLIDVQFQGCARTSRVVGAISSVQTYVHRILLNLEQDRRAVDDPGHVHVLPSSIPHDEWSWRKTYRVWEANRKVFLWPENYLEPELRDDRTSLFKTLEDALLQQDINEQNVLDAYGAYLSGFEEVAGLRIAGAYHELSWAGGKDVLHLFGATNADPPVYYHWTIENLYFGKHDPDRQVSYSARRRIDVSIPARTVTAIVYLGRLYVFWNEIVTTSSNEVKNGESTFVGYRHKVATRFVSLRLDGAWTAPQTLHLHDQIPYASGGIIVDSLTWRAGYGAAQFGYPAHSTTMDQHTAAQDGYALKGFQWENTYPVTYGDRLITISGGFYNIAETDPFEQVQKPVSAPLQNTLRAVWGGQRHMLHIGRSGTSRSLYAPRMGNSWGWGSPLFPAALQALVADIDGFQDFFLGWNVWSSHLDNYVDMMNLTVAKRGAPLGRVQAGVEAMAVAGAPGGAGLILQTNADSMYVRRAAGLLVTGYDALRLGTTMARTLSRTLFTGGIDRLLSLETQTSLGEAPHLLTPLSPTLGVGGRTGAIDFTGPMGVYYREIYFHIPLLIAASLNARQNFAGAQAWFHYIFDPTATLDPGTALAGLSAGQRTKVLRDRVWRYIEFRNLTPPRLRDILTDEAAIKAYKDDPFNPYAIARLRISAFQKSVVMRYVSNLIDWGDSLFTQFTMESVNEAIVLYVMASEILGERPADVGDCGEGVLSPKDYETIRPTIERGSAFLQEVETTYWVAPRAPKLSRQAGRGPSRFIDYIRNDGEIRLADAIGTVKVLAQVPAIQPPRATPDPAPAPGRAATGPVIAGPVIAGPAVTRPVLANPARTTAAATRFGSFNALLDAGAGSAPVLPLRGVVAADFPLLGMADNAVLRRNAPRQELRADFADAGAAFAAVSSPMLADAMASRASLDRVAHLVGPKVAEAASADASLLSHQDRWNRTRTVNWSDAKGRPRRHVGNDSILIDGFGRTGRFGWGVVRQLGPVFCIPQNKDLAALWDRVDDRLYKIRNCLDITGQRRDLALFAPEIDPRLLVRARAEGLSIEDVLGTGSGNLPPYRFAYLIDKARQYASSVQAYGAQLLATLEKKDGEELARLRNTQALNMLKLGTKMREWDLKIAEDGVAQVAAQIAAVEYRRDYYAGLIDTDLLAWERTQQVLRHSSTGFYALGAAFGGTAGVVSLIPQLGSPFAMKYGGLEVGGSLKGWAACFSDTARLLDTFAASAGLEASFQRRREGWGHQVELAKDELKQLARTLSIANVRRDIASRAIDLHQRNIDDQNEIIEFFGGKLTGLGLYTWMSASLQRLYRQSFNAAQGLARLAERAYRFERGDETTPLLQATYWDASHSGLLAGEALMADIADMEKRFIETNYRTLEVDQSFSLLQLDPAELLRLRQTGACEVAIPEYAFDLFYPGQYRRRIRSARVTIPCVTGPYTNVAAVLTLKQSFVRAEPRTGAADLVELPLRHTSTIATSTAQNDAGVFDFSFRDERYMPFEGAGAISIWSLTLPGTFRPFDYQTVTDVILHLSYQALGDGLLRAKVESDNATLEGAIGKALADRALPRIVSLRQDQSSVFQRLVHSAPGTPAAFDLDERSLPIFLRGRTVNVTRALLLVRPGAGAMATGTVVRLDGASISGFAAAPDFPGWRSADAGAALAAGLLGRHTIDIEQAGDLAPAPPVAGDPAACDPARLLDLALYVELGL